MILTELSSKQIAKVIKLIKKKEVLQAKIDAIDAQLGGTPSKKLGRPKASGGKTTGRRGRGGKLKEKIVEALTAAGPEGIKVKDLAAKLKVPSNNVFSWFYTTGKTFKNLKKVGPATYAFVS